LETLIDDTKKETPAPESFRDRIATVDAKGKRKWVYPQKPKGRFYRYRTWMSWFFFVLFFSLPFIQINDRPLFLFDVTKARFILFGKIFWPHDFFIFGITMITFIVFIVLFTAAFGRLFCGWVCPQTIFLEMLFRKIEYFIEGDAPAQKLLKKEPWTFDKTRKKLTKHIIFYLLSFVIANFFLSYIIGMKELWKIISEPPSQHMAGLFSIAIFSGVFYSVYAFFREQACTVVCPYGRLQGVLLDRNSMIVAYDYKRGEPRGKFSKKNTAELGDCLDCFQCVKVCPTGIDIRNGTQLECVGCTACIDACDHMMEKTGRAKGLVRYASENGIQNNQHLRYTGRMKFYTVILILLCSLLGFLIYSRKDIDATVIRTPGILYQERGTDSISNLFSLKVVNKTSDTIPLTLKLEQAAGQIQVIGKASGIVVNSEAEAAGTFFVVVPRTSINKRKTELRLGLYRGGKRIDVIKTNFLGPVTE
jgi:cytochrome c oxidase accessory protein FixG